MKVAYLITLRIAYLVTAVEKYVKAASEVHVVLNETMKVTYSYRQRSVVNVDSHLALALCLPTCPISCNTRPAYKI